MNKQKALVVLTMIAAFSFNPVFAADEHNAAPGLSAAGAPVGLHGSDPVALIEIGNRLDGTAKYTATHEGVAYYFSSQDNLDAFKARPAMYIPENGGFCTFGVSVGKKFDGDPRYAAVVNGKLYVFLNEDIFKMFQKDKIGTITKANTQWKKIQHTPANTL
jgi:YHS domain-containing protein